MFHNKIHVDDPLLKGSSPSFDCGKCGDLLESQEPTSRKKKKHDHVRRLGSYLVMKLSQLRMPPLADCS